HGSPAESGPSPGEAFPGTSGAPGDGAVGLWHGRRVPARRCPLPAALPLSAACEQGPGRDRRGGSSEAGAAHHGLGSLCSGAWGLPGGKSSASRAGGDFRYLGSLPAPLSRDILRLPQNLSGWEGAQASGPACSSRVILEHRARDCVQTVLE
ncbi:hypothetical protein Nmel_002184, partial [Mimus melanotis]